MAAVMAEPKRKAKKPTTRRTGKPVNVWISDEVRDALDEFVDQAEPRAKLNAHVELAIKEYLAKRNAWPRHPPDMAPDAP